jgi:hypothetical protein
VQPPRDSTNRTAGSQEQESTGDFGFARRDVQDILIVRIASVSAAIRPTFVARSLVPTLLVLLSQAALVAVLYWPTLQLAFVSDSWVYLARLRTSVWETLTTPTGYHYQPVACAWIALIRACFGENAAAFQGVLLLQLVSFSYLAYQLGRRLLPDPGVAFLGSLLVIGNAAFFETMYWPLAGNMHLLAAQLYVLALILTIDIARGRFPVTGPWLLGLTVLAAIFTHPAMITAVPVCAVTMFLAADTTGQTESRKSSLARKLHALAVLAAVTLPPFFLSRFLFAAEFDLGPKPAITRVQAYWLVSRGVVSVFSLRGAHDVLNWMMTLGTNAVFYTRPFWFWVAAWVVVVPLVAGVCFWRTRTPGVRVLISFMAIHVTIAAIAGGMSSRQSHLPAVSAGLLTAWAFRSVAERLAMLTTVPSMAPICRQLPAVGILILITWGGADHRTAAEVHLRAANLSRALVEHIRVLAPEGKPVHLTLVNMPAGTYGGGLHAATFANGLHELTRLTSSSVATLDLLRVAIPSAPPDFANGSVLVTPAAALKPRLLEPARVALIFESTSGIRVLTPDVLDRLVLP